MDATRDWRRTAFQALNAWRMVVACALLPFLPACFVNLSELPSLKLFT